VNKTVDALSRALVTEVLQVEVVEEEPIMDKIRKSPRGDSELNLLIKYLEEKSLPEDPVQARRIVTQAQKGYFVMDGVLYCDVAGRRCLLVPASLQQAWPIVVLT